MAALPQQGPLLVLTPAQLQRRIYRCAIDLQLEIQSGLALTIVTSNFQTANPTVTQLFRGQKCMPIRGPAEISCAADALGQELAAFRITEAGR